MQLIYMKQHFIEEKILIEMGSLRWKYSVKRSWANLNTIYFTWFTLCEFWFLNLKISQKNKLFDILKRNLNFLKHVWGKLFLAVDNCSVHKKVNAKEFNMKNKIRNIK